MAAEAGFLQYKPQHKIHQQHQNDRNGNRIKQITRADFIEKTIHIDAYRFGLRIFLRDAAK